MLNILGRPTSINVRKVLWLCHELDIPFVNTPWGDGDASRALDAPAFVALNPNKMVPVIDDDGFVMWESNSILRYLAATRERADLYPVAPRERARVDQWIDWQASDLNPAWVYPFKSLVRNAPGYDDARMVANSVARWKELMGVLDQQLQSTQAFICGKTFTLADIAVGLAVHRWFATPIERPPLDAVAAYYERLSQNEGFRRYGRNGTP
ncbi:glutathione S-transferase family protein [Pandoraea apista]|uniref:Glutathione S-transferase n=1 Tax=Pandoraea apista TaxID=93218 RepID=A0A0B5F3G9_9BURK|nr:glutathione S-transferase [Pandoraea apista]AJE98809.1 glutathione S-transferase [Pandoraea apista]AKH72888.1 glutathione S-transferase [Pandoraea apista]AKI61273.1 glutathione S-transferase [Pandoraea apista]ALS65656.1 glutathione S-transferase [Pandoraea apista]AVF39484.1 glutathione S-transferase [Pandoraea apista]